MDPATIALITAGISAAGSILPSFLGGGGNKPGKTSRFDKTQKAKWEDYWNNPINNNPLYQKGSNFLNNLLSGGPNAYEAFDRPLIENFEQQIVPGLLEMGVGAGTGAGASSSSGLNQALAQAGRGLQTDIAGQRGNLLMQALQQALQFAQQPYQNMLSGFGISPYHFYDQGQQEGGLDPFIGALPDLFQAGNNYFRGNKSNNLSGASGRPGGQMPMPGVAGA